MNLQKVVLLLNTIKYLKPIQIYYRLYYLLKNKLGVNRKESSICDGKRLSFLNIPFTVNSYDINKFRFLNLDKTFNDINWNYSEYGKLWTYNLNYFEYLSGCSKEEGQKLIEDFVSKYDQLKDAKEPYPTALRLVNWVKFISKHKIEEESIDKIIYRDAENLNSNLEYHLLANHLLEDAYGLLFAAYYFKNDEWFSVSKKILISELEEEYHDDGAHYEQSPMYHLILLERNLDSVNLVTNNNWKRDIKELLEKRAITSLEYLGFISVKDDFPQFNDAAFGIGRTPSELKHYAKKLGLKWGNLPQGKSSGYRKIVTNDLSLFFDAGSIGPDYQPAHAHADSLSINLYYGEKPILVDTGTSTYEIGERRTLERSTLAHNTIAYSGENSSEVWGGFRVANRAKVNIELDTNNHLVAKHNGYKRLGVNHQREIIIQGNGYIIKDVLSGNVKNESIFSLHFHPDCNLELNNDELVVNETLIFKFEGLSNIKVENYFYAPEFNKLIKAKKIVATVNSECSVQIKNNR